MTGGQVEHAFWRVYQGRDAGRWFVSAFAQLDPASCMAHSWLFTAHWLATVDDYGNLVRVSRLL